MFCKECGQHMSDHERVCSICGARNNALQQENKNAQHSSYVDRYNNHIQPAYNIPNSNPPMKWHKFLVYFYLWWIILDLLVSAYQTITESIDTILWHSKYNLSPDGSDYIYGLFGVVTFGLAVYFVVALQALLRRKKYGISVLLSAFLWDMLCNVIFVLYEIIVRIDIIGDSQYYLLTYVGYILGLIAGGCLLFFTHRIYYAKRMHLFEE